MGIDAGLYAIKNKEYYWFDRLYNISPWKHHHLIKCVEFDHLVQVYDKLQLTFDQVTKECGGVTSDQLIPFLERIFELWMLHDEPYRYHGYWVKSLISFVGDRRDDLFFVATDVGFAHHLDDRSIMTVPYKQISEEAYGE